MLILKDRISGGAVRECYFHPEDKEKCVKVIKQKKDVGALQKELQIAARVKEKLSPFICRYDGHLVETNKGPGLVVGLFRDDDGQVSRKLSEFLSSRSLDADLKNQLDEFFKKLLDHRLYFTDFNLDNFLIVRQKNQLSIKYIDLKSYRVTRTFFKLEMIFPFLWRRKTIRRINRFYEKIL